MTVGDARLKMVSRETKSAQMLRFGSVKRGIFYWDSGGMGCQLQLVMNEEKR